MYQIWTRMLSNLTILNQIRCFQCLMFSMSTPLFHPELLQDEQFCSLLRRSQSNLIIKFFLRWRFGHVDLHILHCYWEPNAETSEGWQARRLCDDWESVSANAITIFEVDRCQTESDMSDELVKLLFNRQPVYFFSSALPCRSIGSAGLLEVPVYFLSSNLK